MARTSEKKKKQHKIDTLQFDGILSFFFLLFRAIFISCWRCFPFILARYDFLVVVVFVGGSADLLLYLSRTTGTKAMVK